MSSIAVVGGGFAGMSAAARLAKLGHYVTLIEQGTSLGGRLRAVEQGPWHLHCPTVTIPGVLRDLFRKSGRPIERVLSLELEFGRRHIWPDGTLLDLAMGNRADQHASIERVLGSDCADDWSLWVDQWADAWEAVRRVALDRLPGGHRDFTGTQWRHLHPRRSLRREAKRGPVDPRLASLVTIDARLAGHHIRRLPAMWAVKHYVERNFGRWSITGGPEALAAALSTRLDERKIHVMTSTHAVSVRSNGDAITGVDTGAGQIAADTVIWCGGTPHDFPANGAPAHGRLPLVPSARTLICLQRPEHEMPLDITVHSDPPLRLWSVDHQHWTVVHHNSEDPLITLARAGLDLRNHVEQRHDLRPGELIGMAHFGWQIASARDMFTHDSASTKPQLWYAGAHTSRSPSMEAIGMGTAAIAEHVGAIPKTGAPR